MAATVTNNKRKIRGGEGGEGKVVLVDPSTPPPPPPKKAKKEKKGNPKPVVEERKCCNCDYTDDLLLFDGLWGTICFGCLLCSNKCMCICNYSDEFELWFLQEDDEDEVPLIKLLVEPTGSDSPATTYTGNIFQNICQFLKEFVGIEKDKLQYARLYCRGTINFGLRHNLMDIPHPSDWEDEFGRVYDPYTEFTTNKDLKLFYSSFLRFIRVMFEKIEVEPVCSDKDCQKDKDGKMYLVTSVYDYDDEMVVNLKSMAHEMLQTAQEDLKKYLVAC